MSWSPVLAPDRDDYFRRGTPVKSGTNYLHHGFGFASESNAASYNTVLNRDVYVPYFIENPVLVDQFSIHNTALASSHLRFGMYAADADWQPVGAPLFDSGSVDTSATGLKTYTPATPMRLGAGPYLAVHNCDSSGMSIYLGQNDGGAYATIGTADLNGSWTSTFWVSRTYGALPTPGTAWNSNSEGSYGWRTFLGMRFVG